MSEQPKRDAAKSGVVRLGDMKAEIDMRCRAVEAIMQVRTTDKGYPTILDEVLEIVGYNDLLTRCESAESDAARVEGERDALYAMLSDELTKRESAESQRDHAQRMVDAAVEAMAHRNCLYVDVLEAPIPDKPCAYWKTMPHTEESCRKCVRDYLDGLAKEGEKR